MKRLLTCTLRNLFNEAYRCSQNSTPTLIVAIAYLDLLVVTPGITNVRIEQQTQGMHLVYMESHCSLGGSRRFSTGSCRLVFRVIFAYLYLKSLFRLVRCERL